MRVNGRFRSYSAPEGRGATVQFFKGRKGLSQGAHCAPRELTVGDRPLYDHVSPLCVMRSLLQGLFAEVDVLPLAFNSVDSDAENRGLEDAFAQAASPQLSL
jgi:hypothetical protein